MVPSLEVKVVTTQYRQERARGQALVEFAFLLPVLLVLLVGVVDVGRAYYAEMVALNAAWAGARVGADYAKSDGYVADAVNKAAAPYVPTSVLVTTLPANASTDTPCTSGTTGPRGLDDRGKRICVRVTLQHAVWTPLVSGWLGNTLTVRRSAQMVIQ